MNRPLKQIKSLIKEIEDLKIEGPERLDLPQLTIKYETWYTKALRVVQNLVPERLEDFVSAYKNNRSGPVSYSTYTIQDYLLGIKVNRSSRADYDSALLFRRLILRQVGILSSAIAEQARFGKFPGRVLCRRNFITERSIRPKNFSKWESSFRRAFWPGPSLKTI